MATLPSVAFQTLMTAAVMEHHVAGIVGGLTYGVAKNATLHAGVV